ARGDWVISIAQYAALSFSLMAAMSVDRTRRAGLLAAVIVVPACISLSVAIEFIQLYFPPRTVSLNDIILESFGGMFGAFAWLVAGQRITTWARRLAGAASLAELAGWLLPCYFFALLVIHLIPFDFVVARQELASKFSEGKVRLVPFNSPINVIVV